MVAGDITYFLTGFLFPEIVSNCLVFILPNITQFGNIASISMPTVYAASGTFIDKYVGSMLCLLRLAVRSASVSRLN